MKRLRIAGLAVLLVLIFLPARAAENKNAHAATVVVPAESIAHFVKPLLPFRIDAGENFKGALWVKSIENIRIKKNRIYFSTHIYGENIKYVTKVQKREVSLELGSVDLQNNWQASVRYDDKQKKLFIKPHIEEPDSKNELSQGDAILNTLLMALSDLEYPIDVNDLKPIRQEFNNRVLIINMVISDVYTKSNRLFVNIVPTPRIEEEKKK
jgi:hypothetical protein